MIGPGTLEPDTRSGQKQYKVSTKIQHSWQTSWSHNGGVGTKTSSLFPDGRRCCYILMPGRWDGKGRVMMLAFSSSTRGRVTTPTCSHNTFPRLSAGVIIIIMHNSCVVSTKRDKHKLERGWDLCWHGSSLLTSREMSLVSSLSPLSPPGPRLLVQVSRLVTLIWSISRQGEWSSDRDSQFMNRLHNQSPRERELFRENQGFVGFLKFSRLETC